MGDEERVVEFKSPDSRLAAYPTEMGVSVLEGSGSRGACGRREIGLYQGVVNSGLGTRRLGSSGRNGDGKWLGSAIVSAIKHPRVGASKPCLRV